MAFRYAISDPHGCLDVLGVALGMLDLSGDNHLYLLGDYIPHETVDMTHEEWRARSVEALAYVRGFAEAHPGHVTVLCGNHELYLLLEDEEGTIDALPDGLCHWLQRLPPIVETDDQLFVHAGVDEESGDLWRWGSTRDELCGKYPPTVGRYEKDVVAGHVSARKLAREYGWQGAFEGVFWDGESHYYIDGTTERSGQANILRFDVERRWYTQRIVTATDAGPWLPIDPIGCYGDAE